VILHASNGFSSDQPAVRQLHVQPAFGLALISAMAASTAAFVFVSFGALVWHLLHWKYDACRPALQFETGAGQITRAAYCVPAVL
jgi:hypothetical protein